MSTYDYVTRLGSRGGASKYDYAHLSMFGRGGRQDGGVCEEEMQQLVDPLARFSPIVLLDDLDQ